MNKFKRKKIKEEKQLWRDKYQKQDKMDVCLKEKKKSKGIFRKDKKTEQDWMSEFKRKEEKNRNNYEEKNNKIRPKWMCLRRRKKEKENNWEKF